MRELDAPADREQPGVHRWVDSRHVDLEDLGRRMQEDRITERLGGRGEHKKPRVARQSAEPSCEPVFDRFRDGTTYRQSESPGEFRGSPRSRKLEQGQRVPVAFGDDLIADGRI